MNGYLVITTILGYLIAAGMHAFRLAKGSRGGQFWLQSWIFLPLLTHAVLLHHWIDTPIGQNLSLANDASMISWLASFLLWISAWRNPVTSLYVVVLPIAALSTLLAVAYPSAHIVATAANPIGLAHILLSILAAGIMTLAAIQALLLVIQDWLLRRHQGTNWLSWLPSLEVMEKLLFKIIELGFIILTLILITSITFFQNIFVQPLLTKLLLTGLVWLCFMTLLLGRYYGGWRGRKAIHLTLISVIFLLLIYFGSEIII